MMSRLWQKRILCGVGALMVGGMTAGAAPVVSPSPARLSVDVYDSGFASIRELRRFSVPAGPSDLHIKGLPARTRPMSISQFPAAGAEALNIRVQRFAWDAGELDRLLRLYRGHEVVVRTRSGDIRGRLVAAGAEEEAASYALRDAEGALHAVDRAEAVEIIFPDAETRAFLEPTLVWETEAAGGGPVNLRLAYQADGWTWRAIYELLMDEAEETMDMSVRFSVENRSGADIENARLRFVATEKGQTAPLFDPRGTRPDQEPALWYRYGRDEPALGRLLAGLSTLDTYELQEPATLPDGQTRHFAWEQVRDMPVDRFYVYDGVIFERFQQNRRNDWNYGTESRNTVETYLEFDNTADAGLGVSLPPGRLRLYRQHEDGMLSFAGEEFISATPVGQRGHVRLGPAPDLRGERKRTHYREVTPLKEYEESFEIRLENTSDRDVTIRVVEHLYRWPDFEIVKADTPYQETGDQRIEFRPVLKAGGTRSIHYTVRYRW